MKLYNSLREHVEACSVPEPNTGCWLWTKRLDAKGYGRTKALKRYISGHELAWIAFRGLVPEGMQLDHLCRVRSCVNPDHLEPVTRRENIRRGVSPVGINAKKTHCKRGHPLVQGERQRYCLVCQRLRGRGALRNPNEVASGDSPDTPRRGPKPDLETGERGSADAQQWSPPKPQTGSSLSPEQEKP